MGISGDFIHDKCTYSRSLKHGEGLTECHCLPHDPYNEPHKPVTDHIVAKRSELQIKYGPPPNSTLSFWHKTRHAKHEESSTEEETADKVAFLPSSKTAAASR